MADVWKICAPISFLLTLATWLVFRNAMATTDASLDNSEIAFVFGFWFVTVFAFRWLVRRIRKQQGGGSHGPSET